jgi:large subunit ribosomal protein L14
MIQTKTKLKVADNSGAKIVECIKVFPKSGYNNASIGDIIVVSVKKAMSKKKVKKGQVLYALIVRTKKNLQRNDGSTIKFDDNAVVLLNSSYAPIGTRVFGPIVHELRQRRFMKVISLASCIL